MNKLKYSFIVLLTILAFISCSKKDDDNIVVVPPKPFDEQYAVDIVDIEEYLNNNYITVDADYNVTVAKITDAATQKSIMSYKDNSAFPKLLSREVKVHEIVYKLYYLVIREGQGESPINVDGVLTAYSGSYLSRSTVNDATTQNSTNFETVQYPSSIFDLFNTIRGWKEVFPQFKAGSYVSNEDGTVTYDNYGVGMMFVPSGLGYYSNPKASIPAYSPLVFSFKLLAVEHLDHEYKVGANGIFSPDPDGVLSIYEDLDGDGYVWTASELNAGVVNPDDTDGDGIPDFLDKDDDGDNYTTKLEIRNPVTGKPYAYEDIPTCASGKKNYLDATCHP